MDNHGRTWKGLSFLVRPFKSLYFLAAPIAYDLFLRFFEVPRFHAKEFTQVNQWRERWQTELYPRKRVFLLLLRQQAESEEEEGAFASDF